MELCFEIVESNLTLPYTGISLRLSIQALSTFNMADEVTENEFCQTLRTFLPEEKFEEVKKLLREVRISILFVCTYIPIKLFTIVRLKHLSFVGTLDRVMLYSF